jgi:preprotein translocase subunit SecG
MHQIVLVIHLMLAIALIIVVLMQRSEGAGLSGLGTAGSGGMGGFLSGRGQANLLTRTTAILAAGFIATSILLAVIARQTAPTGSIFDQGPAPAAEEEPLQPSDSGTEGGEPVQPAAPSVPLGQ